MIDIVETLGSGLYGTSFSIHPHYSTMTLKGTHALFTFWSQNHPLYDPRSRSCHVIYERSFIFILFVL